MANPIEWKPGMRVLEDVTPLDKLKPRIARMHTVEEGLAQRRVMQDEIMKLGKFTQARGLTPGRNFQRVASVPPSVWSAVMEVFGSEWAVLDRQGRQKLFFALLAGPLRDYDLRKKPTLT